MNVKEEFLKLHPGRQIGIAGAALLVLASFLPWAHFEVFGKSQSILGIQGDGVLQIILAIAAGVLFFMTRFKIWAAMIPTGIAALVGIMDYFNISQANQQLEGMGSFGFGFYLVPLAVAGMIAGCVWEQVDPEATNPIFPKLEVNADTEAQVAEPTP